MTREDRINGLISLDEKINNELFSLQRSMQDILKYVSDEEWHTQYLSRISYIQTLFDRVSDIRKDLSLTESDAHFFEALQAKDRISNNYVRFNRMCNQVERAFNKDIQSDTELFMRTIDTLQHIVEEEPAEENAELSTETEAEEMPDDFLQEELLMREEELAAKKKKKLIQRKADAERQKAIIDAENKRHLEEEQRYRESQRQQLDDSGAYKVPDYENPSSQAGYPVAEYSSERPEKPVSAADLRDEQYREEERCEAEREESRARRQEMHDKFLAYQDEHRPEGVPPRPDAPQSSAPTYTTPDNPTSGSRPEKPVSAADLRDEQYREEERREAEREQSRARRQEMHDKFLAYQDEHRPEGVPSRPDTPQSSAPTYTTPDNPTAGSRPEKPVSAADLRDEQYREEERRAAEREESRARRQETHDKFLAYQDNNRPEGVPPRPEAPQSSTPSYTMPNNSDTRAHSEQQVSAPQSHNEPRREDNNREPGRVPLHGTGPDTYRSRENPSTGHGSVSPPRQQSPKGSKNDSAPQRFAFVPSGVGKVNYSSSKASSNPGNGSFQGGAIQRGGKPASSDKTVSVSSGSKERPVKHSEKTPTASAVPHGRDAVKGKTDKPKTEYTRYGYMPAGVFANTSVNGVMGQNHTSYKTVRPGYRSAEKIKGVQRVGQSTSLKTDKTAVVSSKSPGVKAQKGKDNSTVQKPVPRKTSTNKTGMPEPQRAHVPITGTTGQTKRGNANKTRKVSVKESGPELVKQGKHMRTQAIAKTYAKSYAKAMGGKVARYAGGAAAMGARKLYQIIQDGDDNVVRGFENTRYYGLTTINSLSAISKRPRLQASVNKAFGKKVKVKNIGSELNALKEKHNRILQKKFGPYNTLSKKALSNEIKTLMEQGKSIKQQIKLLQSKGAALSAAERKTLMQLIKKHKEQSQRLRKLIGLKKSRLELDKAFSKAKKAGKSALKNSRTIKNGLFALRRSLMSSLYKSDESGVQGLAKALDISTNRYVHSFIKGSLRASWGITKFGVRVTHLDKAAKVVAKNVKKSTKAVTKSVNKALVKTGRTAGQQAKRLIPKKVKTLPGSSIKKVLKKPHVAGAKQVFQNAAKTSKNVAVATKKGVEFIGSLFRGVSWKVIAVVFAFILLIGIIATIVSSISGAAGSIIISPDTTEDGKLDLSSYYEIVIDEWNDYIKDLNKQGKNEGAEKVVVNMEALPDNTREILAMMAVRMSQDIDIDENDEIEPYLRYLVRQLNPFTKEVSYYSCSGCETYWVDKKSVTYCPGRHKMITFNVTAMHFGPAEDLDDPIFSADEMANEDQEVTDGSLIGVFEITHYAPTGNKTATGTTPKAGRTIAVDPDVIPLGSHVIIDGHEYVAEDTGGVIKGNIIDIFVNSEAEAVEKGRRENVRVYHVDYAGGDVQSSGKWQGWTDGNKQWAKNIYYQDWADLYSGIPMLTGIGNNSTDLSGVKFVEGNRTGNQKIVDIAKAQEGYQEGKKFYSWYGFDYHVHWCATFVSWCANQAGVINSAVPKFAHCALQGVPWFQNKGQWARPGDITPVAGDIIFFDWEQDGRADHVGIVIGSDSSKVYTIEGNTGDYPGVARIKSYSLSYRGLYGYGIPNY